MGRTVQVRARLRVSSLLLCLCAMSHAPWTSGQIHTTSLPEAPRAINDDGVVIGDASVFYRSGPVGLVGPLGGGVNTLLVAVNGQGHVLLAQTFGGLRYFVCQPLLKKCTPIGLRGEVNEEGTVRRISLAYLTGLDDAGRVFGVYSGAHGPCAVMGIPALGTRGDPGPPPETPASYSLLGCPVGRNLVIRAMNARGQITGSVNGEGFLWSSGTLSRFSFPTSPHTEGYAINDAGVVAGVFQVGNGISDDGTVSARRTPGLSLPQRGFVYDGSQFRIVMNPKDRAIYVTGINNRGQVVGYYASATDVSINHGFLIESGALPVAHLESIQ